MDGWIYYLLKSFIMQLEIFKYKPEGEQVFNDVRTFEENGEIWFWATDVARVLGYANVHAAVLKHCKPKGVTNREVLVGGSKQIVKFINEGNVYRLISRSRLKTAQRFEDWVFDEVIPSIRRKGFYGDISRIALPDFVKRFKDNLYTVPSDYFSVITEMYVRLYAELEKVGYKIPDKGAHGKTMMPDISVGRYFSEYLKENHSDLWDKHKTYKHRFPDGRVVDAYMYPVEALPLFIKYINERWLFERADKYFKDKDPLALEFLPKLLESKKKTA